MNISRTLTPAMLALALLLTVDMPQAGSPFQAPFPASAGLPAAQVQRQQVAGGPAPVNWVDVVGIEPITPAGSTPTRTQTHSGLASTAGTAWLQGAGNATHLIQPETATPSSKFRAKARAVLNKYGCSSSGIRLNDKRLGRYANGMADWYNNVVLLRSSMPASRVTYVSAHECMHMRQYRAYKGNVDKLAAAMNRIYGGKGFTGLERNADCMTRAVGIKVSNSAYASSCSGAKKMAALKVLNGKHA